MSDEKKIDLFDNPMVDAAKKSMTPEQLESYKEMGKYMYSTNFQVKEAGEKKKPDDAEIAQYALNAVRSGLEPKELTQRELQALWGICGAKWYEEFGYAKEDVPEVSVNISDADLKNMNEKDLKDTLKNMKLCRQQRRHLERTLEKAARKKGKK